MGRQSVLKQLEWAEDGWPRLGTEGVQDWSPSPFGAEQERWSFIDTFRQGAIAPGWEWPMDAKPQISTGANGLTLAASANAKGNFGALLTRRVAGTEFVASTTALPKEGRHEAGLIIYGDPANAIGIGAEGEKIFAWRVQNGKKLVMYSITRKWSQTVLRITARADVFHLDVSPDGVRWEPLGADVGDQFHSGWDGAIRAGLYTAKGSSVGRFRVFELNDLAAAGTASTDDKQH